MATRIDLHGLGGVRFWLTLLLVGRRAFASMVPLVGGGGPLCTFLNYASHDLVSAYFILGGFAMTWGYYGRSLEGIEKYTRFVSRRFSRFYPDFLLSSVVTYFLNLPFIFGCQWSLSSIWTELLALSMVNVWIRLWTPEMLPANGPSWFIVTLLWLWLLFPLIRDPLVSFFSGDRVLFWLKLTMLWLLTVVFWAFINGTLFFHPEEPVIIPALPGFLMQLCLKFLICATLSSSRAATT